MAPDATTSTTYTSTTRERLTDDNVSCCRVIMMSLGDLQDPAAMYGKWPRAADAAHKPPWHTHLPASEPYQTFARPSHGALLSTPFQPHSRHLVLGKKRTFGEKKT